MIGKLVYLSKNGEEKEELPVVNLHFFIGSDLFCDLRIKHKDIAAQHCLITLQKDKPALIRNLSRTVPTLVNKTEIGTSDVELKDQDIITIRHKHFKWRYDCSSEPSTSSSHSSFGAASKNRKSWPLFKNKLVAVVTPQRRDEDVQVTEKIQLGTSPKEVLPKKRRGTVGEISTNKKAKTPKVLAVKTGLKATYKQNFRKRKSSNKTAQLVTGVESTPQSLPPSKSKKSVKFLNVSKPSSRLGKRGQKRSLVTPYVGTPNQRKASVKFTLGKREAKISFPTSNHVTSASLKVPMKSSLGRRTLRSSSSDQASLTRPKISAGIKSRPLGRKSMLGLRRQMADFLSSPLNTCPEIKVSLYSTPPSTFRYNKSKPIKSILKTPTSSSSSVKEPEQNLSRLVVTNLVGSADETPVTDVSEGCRPLVLENDLLHTPLKADQPEVVMRSSRRRASIIKSPPSTPKSSTKKRKSLEEKSVEVSERAAKKLKRGPPHVIDEKKRAALLQCHRKSLTPHPEAIRSRKLFTRLPTSFSSEVKTVSPINTRPFSKSRNSKSACYSTVVPKVFRFSSLREHTGSEMVSSQSTVTSKEEDIKPGKRRSLSKSVSKVLSTSPIIKKFTRPSRAAHASRELQQKEEVDAVLSALDLSRRWPPPSQGSDNANTPSQMDASNLSGIKKLFNTDKTLDANSVRELFLENSSEAQVAFDKYIPSLSDSKMSRWSTLSAVSRSEGRENSSLINSFHSEGAQELLCSESLLNGSSLSVPGYSSTSRRSLSLKRGRKSTASPNNVASSSEDVSLNTTAGPSCEKRPLWNRDIQGTLSNSMYRNARRSRNVQSISLNKNFGIDEESLNSETCDMTASSHQTFKSRDSDTNELLVSSNGRCPKNDTNDPNTSFGSLNSYSKCSSSDSLSLLHVSDISISDGDSVKSKSKRNDSQNGKFTPLVGKSRRKGRVSLRKTILKASTPKPDKISCLNGTLLSLEEEIGLLETNSGLDIPFQSYTRESNLLNSKLSSRVAGSSYVFVCGDVSQKLNYTANKPTGRAKSISHSLALPSNADSFNAKEMMSVRLDSEIFRSGRRGLQGSNLNCVQNIEEYGGFPQHVTNKYFKSTEPMNSASENLEKSGYSSSQNFNVKERIMKDKILTPTQVATVPVVNKNTEKQGRPSKHCISNETTQTDMSQPAVKRRSLRLLSRGGEQTTPKYVQLLTNVRHSTGKRGRPPKNVNMVDKDTEDVSVLSIVSKSLSSSSLNDVITTPVGEEKIPVESKSTGRRGRPSKNSISNKIAQTETSPPPLKQRSLSLPSRGAEQTTPKDVQLLTNVRHSTGRRGRPPKNVNIVDKDTKDVSVLSIVSQSLSSSSLNDVITTPEGVEKIPVDSKSTGRRGRPSKNSISNKIAQTETVPPPLKQRSLSLPSRGAQQTTSKDVQLLTNVRHSTGRRGRPPKNVNIVDKDTKDVSVLSIVSQSLSSSSLNDVITTPEGVKKIPVESKSTGRRGRPSKHSISYKLAQTETSPPPLKHRSLSLPSRGAQQTTPKDVQLLTNVRHSTGRRGRPTKNVNIVDKDTKDVSVLSIVSQSLSSSSLNDVITTPEGVEKIPVESKSTGRRGRPSKNSISNKIAQTETVPPPLKQRSLSLPSRGAEQTTLKDVQLSTNVRHSTGRRGRPPKNVNMVDKDTEEDVSVLSIVSQSPSSSSLNDVITTPEGVEKIPVVSKSTGRRGRPSKNSISNKIAQTETSPPPLKQRSLSLPSRGTEQTTPKDIQLLTNVHHSTGRRGRPPKNVNIVDTKDVSVLSIVSQSLSSSSINDVITTEGVEKIPVESKSTGRRGRPSKNCISNEIPSTSVGSICISDNKLDTKTDVNHGVDKSEPMLDITPNAERPIIPVSKSTGKRERLLKSSMLSSVTSYSSHGLFLKSKRTRSKSSSLPYLSYGNITRHGKLSKSLLMINENTPQPSGLDDVKNSERPGRSAHPDLYKSENDVLCLKEDTTFKSVNNSFYSCKTSNSSKNLTDLSLSALKERSAVCIMPVVSLVSCAPTPSKVRRSRKNSNNLSRSLTRERSLSLTSDKDLTDSKVVKFSPLLETPLKQAQSNTSNRETECSKLSIERHLQSSVLDYGAIGIKPVITNSPASQISLKEIGSQNITVEPELKNTTKKGRNTRNTKSQRKKYSRLQSPAGRDDRIKLSMSSLVEESINIQSDNSTTKSKISTVSHKNRGVKESTNKLLQEIGSLSHCELDLNNIVNESTSKSKEESSTKTTLRSHTLKHGSPLTNETNIDPIASKENKVSHKYSQIRKSYNNNLVISDEDGKGEDFKTASVSTKIIPVVVLSPVKRRTRAALISKHESLRTRKKESLNIESSLVEEISALPLITINKLLGKRKAQVEKCETENELESHSNKKKPTRGKKQSSENSNDVHSVESPPKRRKRRNVNLDLSIPTITEDEKILDESHGITTRRKHFKRTNNLSPQDVPGNVKKKLRGKAVKVEDPRPLYDNLPKNEVIVKDPPTEEELSKTVKKGRQGRLITNHTSKENKIQAKSPAEVIVSSEKSSLPRREKREARVGKEVGNEETTKTRGPLAKENSSLRSISVMKKGRKANTNINLSIAEESVKREEVKDLLPPENEPNRTKPRKGRPKKILNPSNQNEIKEGKKTRSQVTVVAENTTKKDKPTLISSPIVKSSAQLRRGRSNKLVPESPKVSPLVRRRDRLQKETIFISTSNNQNANLSQNIVLAKKNGRKSVQVESKRLINEVKSDTSEQKSVKKSSVLALRSGRAVTRSRVNSPAVEKKGKLTGKTIAKESKFGDEAKWCATSSPIQRRGRSATRRENISSLPQKETGKQVVEEQKTLKSAIKNTNRISLSEAKVKKLPRSSTHTGFDRIRKKTVHFKPDGSIVFITPAKNNSRIVIKKRKTSNAKGVKKSTIKKK